MHKHSDPALSKLNWDDLRYFLEVARTQRASGAAKRLGVDYTTVARRIRALEEAMGPLPRFLTLPDQSSCAAWTLS